MQIQKDDARQSCTPSSFAGFNIRVYITPHGLHHRSYSEALQTEILLRQEIAANADQRTQDCRKMQVSPLI
jgi:hypothetical protein